tara:strand:+ start:190 stop:720 length:531 start_codon:yes stop_codon:yes gene_type:complete
MPYESEKYQEFLKYLVNLDYSDFQEQIEKYTQLKPEERTDEQTAEFYTFLTYRCFHDIGLDNNKDIANLQALEMHLNYLDECECSLYMNKARIKLHEHSVKETKNKINYILESYPNLSWYHQEDCRGCSVHIYALKDLKEGDKIHLKYNTIGHPVSSQDFLYDDATAYIDYDMSVL